MTFTTCATCEHFLQFFGEPRGECYGNLPAVFASGSHSEGEITPPKVKAVRPGCWAHKPLADGEPTRIKGKVRPDTVGEAIKAARVEHPAPTPADKAYMGPIVGLRNSATQATPAPAPAKKGGRR